MRLPDNAIAELADMIWNAFSIHDGELSRTQCELLARLAIQYVKECQWLSLEKTYASAMCADINGFRRQKASFQSVAQQEIAGVCDGMEEFWLRLRSALLDSMALGSLIAFRMTSSARSSHDLILASILSYSRLTNTVSKAFRSDRRRFEVLRWFRLDWLFPYPAALGCVMRHNSLSSLRDVTACANSLPCGRY